MGKSLRTKEQDAARKRQEHRRMRSATIAYLGGKCATCGFSDSRILHVDHIHNDGAEERRAHRAKNSGRHADMTRYYFNHMTEGRYQLLCPNCNALKEYLRRFGNV